MHCRRLQTDGDRVSNIYCEEIQVLKETSGIVVDEGNIKSREFLPTATRADDSDSVSRRNSQREVLQNRSVCRVAEGHVSELNSAPGHGKWRCIRQILRNTSCVSAQ